MIEFTKEELKELESELGINGWVDEYGNTEDVLSDWMIEEPNVIWKPYFVGNVKE